MEDDVIRVQCIEFAMRVKDHALSNGMGMSQPATTFDPATVIEDATTYYEFVTNKGDN